MSDMLTQHVYESDALAGQRLAHLERQIGSQLHDIRKSKVYMYLLGLLVVIAIICVVILVTQLCAHNKMMKEIKNLTLSRVPLEVYSDILKDNTSFGKQL
jgi:uncharacterized membrane protein